MENTLSNNKQMFNVKSVASAGLDIVKHDIYEGLFKIIDIDTNTTVLPTTFEQLPEHFTFLSKCNDKVYYTFDTINKNKIVNAISKKYTEQKVNIWKTVIESCNCIEHVQLNINMRNDYLIRRDGIRSPHRDFVIVVSPKELKCLNSCSGYSAYENNVITKLLFDKIQNMNSPFYEAKVRDDEGKELATSKDIQDFIDTNKKVNTDEDKTNDKKLTFVLQGKLEKAGNYADLDVNYIYPRGIRLNPSLIINSSSTVKFEEEQSIQFEIGAGYDLRKEEFDCMNLYTNLNFYPQLSDGIQNKNLVYQFENNKKYNTVTFEFISEKSGIGIGREKRFSILLGIEDTTLFSYFQNLFKFKEEKTPSNK